MGIFDICKVQVKEPLYIKDGRKNPRELGEKPQDICPANRCDISEVKINISPQTGDGTSTLQHRWSVCLVRMCQFGPCQLPTSTLSAMINYTMSVHMSFKISPKPTQSLGSDLMIRHCFHSLRSSQRSFSPRSFPLIPQTLTPSNASHKIRH